MTFTSQSQLKINLAALGRNWEKFNKLGSSNTSAVVKADAYGLGAREVTKVLQECGCDTFFVAHYEEAIEARKFIAANAKIYVLNGVFENQCDGMVEFDIIPIINSYEQLEIWQTNTKQQNYALHIDTGMNRLGLRHDDSFDNDYFKDFPPHLILSHLACGSDINSQLNKTQLERFKNAAQIFPNSLKSLSASAGSLLGNEYHFDIIRPGIGLYGGNPLDDCANIFNTIVELKSPIIQTRKVKKGESIGYGASFIAKKEMQIGIVSLGYADGFLRNASNKGFGFIDGKMCKILGRVSMDLIAIDLSETKDIKTGDYVEFLGDNITIDMQANHANTISYEFLTRLGTRFKRIYHYD